MQAKLIDLLTKARAASKSQNYIEAEALTKKALKLDASSPDAHLTMGILKASTGNLDEAIKHFKVVLKAHPQIAQVRANLATALYEHQAYEEAIIEFEKALRLEPNLISARVSYASALRKATHYTRAIEEYQNILNRNPQNHEALNGIGLTYMNQGQEDESLNAFHHATKMAPMIPEYHLNFAIALDQFNYHDYARVEFEEALKIKPDWIEAEKYLIDNLIKLKDISHLESLVNKTLTKYPLDADLITKKGVFYIESHDINNAMLFFENALLIDSTNVKAKMGIARIHAEKGEFAKATDVYEDLILKRPEIAITYEAYSRVKKFDSQDKFLEKIKNTISENEVLLSYDVVNFALGKIYDDCKDFDKAFLYYQKANQLTNRYKHYNKKDDQTNFDAIRNFLTRDCINKLSEFGAGKNLPILIIGMPRSGTTLVEDVISRHSKVRGAGEVPFWKNAIQNVMGIDSNYPEIVSKINNIKAKNIAENYLHKLVEKFNTQSDYELIIDKMPHNFMFLGLIAGLFPEMPIIHCKRNAMDNCLSIYFQHFEGDHAYAYDLENVGFHYKQYELLMAHWHEVLPGRILDVNYEDVVADPEYWTRKMIEHVGLEWENSCLEQQAQNHSVKTASVWQVRQPIFKTSVCRWKHYEKHLGPLKEALGYDETQKSS